MIGACPSAIAADALARDVLAGADCLIETQVAQGYATLLAPGGSFVAAMTIALTIYVAIFGYRLILGLSNFTLAEVVPHFIKIGLVLALTTSWPSYQALVFEVLFRGPQQLADLVVGQAAGPGASGGDVLAALQAVFDRLTGAAGDAWSQASPPAVATAQAIPPVASPGVPGQTPTPAPVPATLALPFALGAPQFVAVLLWAAALLLLALSVGVLLVARIVLALLLVLGPLFIAFALFRSTRGVFEGWLRVVVKFALVPLFTLPLIAVVVAVLAPIVATLGETPVVAVRDGPALLILLIVVVFAAVMVQAARLGGGIAGGIRLPRRDPAPAADRAAPVIAATSFDDRLRPATRAETIVRAIDGGGRRGVGGPGGVTEAMVATRAIAPPGPAAQTVADSSGRLGQGYRRLAVASAAAPRRI